MKLQTTKLGRNFSRTPYNRTFRLYRGSDHLIYAVDLLELDPELVASKESVSRISRVADQSNLINIPYTTLSKSTSSLKQKPLSSSTSPLFPSRFPYIEFNSMPKSKRARVVHTSKTIKKGKPLQQKTHSQIQDSLPVYAYLYILSFSNLRNEHLQEVRSRLTESRYVFLSLSSTL